MTDASTYAISWYDGATRFVGCAAFDARVLRLEGRGGRRERSRTLSFKDLVAVNIDRSDGDRALTLDLSDGESVVIWSLDRPGSLGELADRVRKLAN